MKERLLRLTVMAGLSMLFIVQVNGMETVDKTGLAHIQLVHAEIGLVCATRYGDVAEAKRLLEIGVSPDCTDDVGWTSLMYAAKFGHEEIVKMLIEHKATVDYAQQHWNGATALKLACEYGRLAIAHSLIEAGANVNFTGENSVTPLVAACSAHKGASPKIDSNKDLRRIVALLLAKGALVNSATSFGNTPIMTAAARGRSRTVARLVAAGAQVNSCDNSGKTALAYALEGGHLRTAKKLVSAYGADIALKDYDGKIAEKHITDRKMRKKWHTFLKQRTAIDQRTN